MKRLVTIAFLSSFLWSAQIPESGMKAEMDKDWDKAIAIYHETINKEPSRVDLWLRIADIEAQRNNLPGAIVALESALKIDNENTGIMQKLMQAYSMNKQSSNALMMAEKLTAKEPDNIKLLKDYGLLCEENKEWDKAVSVYRSILEKDPTQVELLSRIADIQAAQKNYAGMLETLKQESASKPENAILHYKMAQVYSLQNKPLNALEEINKALKYDPENYEYFKMKKDLVNWSNDYHIQYDKNRKLITQNPNNAKAYHDFAEAAGGLKKEKEAMNAFSEYVKLKPNDLKAWLELAELEKKFKGIQTALASLEKAAEINKLRTAHQTPLKNSNIANIKIPILEYHCVDDQIKNPYFVATKEFDSQMHLLKEQGYSSVVPMDIYNYVYKNGKLPSKPVIITFDDGCQQNYTKIYPILKKHGLKGEFYLITDAVVESSNDRVKQPIDTENGKKMYHYLTWPEVKNMAANGMSFGSHTMTQPQLGPLTDQEVAYELLHSKLALNAYSNIDPTDFSFPFGSGSFQKRIHQLLQKYGYLNAVAAHGGIENTKDIDIYNMRRIEIYGPKPAGDIQSQGILVTPQKDRRYDSFAANIDPSEADTYVQRAAWYTDDDAEEKAVESMNQALAIEPNNMRYISQKALYANWAGELDEAAHAYEKYLEKYPNDKEALINYADVQSWRGDYADALGLYNGYQEQFGTDLKSMESKALMLAWANRSQMAFEVIDKILAKDPKNYSANYAKTVALKNANRPEEAIESLKYTESLRPKYPDNVLLRKFVMTDLRPHIRGEYSYYDDSDDISIASYYMDAKYTIDPSTFIYGGVGMDRLQAPIGSGFETISGKEKIDHTKGWIGGSHRFNPQVSVDGSIGIADAEVEDDFIYSAGLDWRPSDTFNMRFSHDRDYYIVSPKAVSLGITKNETAVQGEWYPSLSESVGFIGSYSTFSDDNNRWGVNLDYIHQVARTQYWNLDVGLNANLFGFDKDLDNGYYDPKWSQTYSVVGYGLWKINQDDSVSIVLSAGMTKDDRMDTFKFASSASLEGRFGLYRDWYMIIRLGHDHNIQQSAGAWKGTKGSVSIMRRF